MMDFLVIFLLPFIMIIIGFFMYRFPIKKINHFIGYRTINSMKNKKNWDAANKYSGKIMMILGFLLLFFSIFLSVLFLFDVLVLSDNLFLFIIILELCVLCSCIFIVEYKLFKK